MKPEILILMERKYSYDEIRKLTMDKMDIIYYYGKKYRQGCEKINLLKLNKIKGEEKDG